MKFDIFWNTLNFTEEKRYNSRLVGVWRSLVAHLHGVQGVEGSNPFTPTIYLTGQFAVELARFDLYRPLFSATGPEQSIFFAQPHASLADVGWP